LTRSRSTADLCDEHAGELEICQTVFESYGANASFFGPVSTILCFEDNSRVKEAVESAGEGRVLVIDGGGSRRCALLGDKLGAAAVRNGWTGVIVNGCVRDSRELDTMPLGIRALGTMPLRSEKRGAGDRDVVVRFGGVTFTPGDYVYVDEDGVLVSRVPLT
jgi:regulator of ribonuclease activity A